MNFKNIFLLPGIFILTGCGLGIKTTVTKNYPPAASQQEVRVLDLHESIPSGAVEIGTVRIYDNMTMKCDSATVFRAAQEEARKAGGNVLKIVEHQHPNLMSSCHQIIGLILRVDNFQDSVFTRPRENKPFINQPVKHDSRLALNAGWSWQTSKISNNLSSFERDYLNELKSGIHYGGEFNYFFKEQSAVSIQFNMFHSSNSVNAAAQTSTGIVTGVLSDEINIFYIAPGITWRILSPTKMNAFLFGLTLGYMHYNDDGKFITPVEISGSTVGLSYDLSYDIGLSRSTALGLGFAWKIGVLSSVDVTQNGVTKKFDLNDDERIGLGHIDLSLGLRFR